MKVSITYYGVTLDCEGDYSRGRPGTWYKRNGDPGDPPEDASFDLCAVRVSGVDISEMLEELSVCTSRMPGRVIYDDVLADIEDACLEAIAEREEEENDE